MGIFLNESEVIISKIEMDWQQANRVSIILKSENQLPPRDHKFWEIWSGEIFGVDKAREDSQLLGNGLKIIHL